MTTYLSTFCVRVENNNGFGKGQMGWVRVWAEQMDEEDKRAHTQTHKHEKESQKGSEWINIKIREQQKAPATNYFNVCTMHSTAQWNRIDFLPFDSYV